MAFRVDKHDIYFNDNFEGPLEKDDVDNLKILLSENGLKSLIMSNDSIFKGSIDILSDVDELEVIRLSNHYRKKIGKLPRNLREFHSGDVFNQLIIFPDSVEIIVFGFSFNTYLEKYPENLKQIEFGKKFNKPLDNLPENLETLYLTGDFSQRLDNLPRNLKKISLMGIYECLFNHPIENLPSGLKEIYFSGYFNQSIDMLPESLEIIYFNAKFDKSIDNLPRNLKKISFMSYSKFNRNIDNLPDSIEEIKLPQKYDIEIKKLPSSLVILEINKTYPFSEKLLEKYPGKIIIKSYYK